MSTRYREFRTRSAQYAAGVEFARSIATVGIMDLRQVTEFSGPLQTICYSQQQALARLIADMEAEPLNTGGTFLDFVHSGMSGRFPMASGFGAAAERHVRELEDLLTKVQSLIALGQAMAALVHEVSQPLTAIGSDAAACCQLAQLGRRAEVDELLQRIIDQSDHAFQITQRMGELVGASDLMANTPESDSSRFSPD